MNRFRLSGMVLGAAMAITLAGCGGSRAPGAPVASPQSPPLSDGPSYRGEATAGASPEAQESPGGYGDGVYGGADKTTAMPPPPPASEARAAQGAGAVRMDAREPTRKERPGLGTAWGETRRSPTTTAPFVRDSASPFGVAALWYNDRAGAEAMSRWADYRSHGQGAVPVLGGALTVSLRDERGRTLPGFFAGGKDYVIGDAGTRYIIVIRNQTSYRYECVASVDGLDVIDGRPASYSKRGYLIQPHDVLEIEGFRRSEDAVAAFRFSSVRGSYAAKSGKGDRNVGVIGVAFFNEEGTRPTWSPDEIRRRHNADPFPGQYAQPPR